MYLFTYCSYYPGSLPRHAGANPRLSVAGGRITRMMDFNKFDARDIMTDEVLRATFDDGTMSRAADYVPFVETASMDVKKDAKSLMVNALVAGTRPQPYQVIFEAYMVDNDLYGGNIAIRAVCSCPVGIACKHSAALAL